MRFSQKNFFNLIWWFYVNGFHLPIASRPPYFMPQVKKGKRDFLLLFQNWISSTGGRRSYTRTTSTALILSAFNYVEIDGVAQTKFYDRLDTLRIGLIINCSVCALFEFMSFNKMPNSLWAEIKFEWASVLSSFYAFVTQSIDFNMVNNSLLIINANAKEFDFYDTIAKHLSPPYSTIKWE